MNTITDDQIAEIEALAGHATPGPWGLTLNRDLSVASSEWGLFDVRQDQPNFVVDANYAAAANPKSVLGLIARLREAERWKADASQVLNPLLDYAHSLGLAKLGHSVTEALIEDHKRLREAERDAARYRWLRSRFVGASFDLDDEGITVLVFEMPPNISIGADCDRNIDAAMQEPQQ